MFAVLYVSSVALYLACWSAERPRSEVITESFMMPRAIPPPRPIPPPPPPCAATGAAAMTIIASRAKRDFIAGTPSIQVDPADGTGDRRPWRAQLNDTPNGTHGLSPGRGAGQWPNPNPETGS